MEIIVVDDGSSDDTRQVIESMNNTLVKYVYKENGGAGSARNLGATLAKGDWIAFHDSDDVWRADKLKLQAEYAKLHTDFHLIYSKYEMHFYDGSTMTVPNSDDKELLEGNLLPLLLVQNTIGAPTILVRKDSFLNIGGFDERLRCIEDWNFVIRFSEKYKIGYLNEITMDAYRVDASVSSNIAEMYEERCRVISQYRSVLEKNGLFDTAVKMLFDQAEKQGCLDAVKKMFIKFIGLSR